MSLAYVPPLTTACWSREASLGDLGWDDLWAELEELLEWAFPSSDSIETVDRYQRMTVTELEFWSELYRSMGGSDGEDMSPEEERHAPLWLAIGNTLAFLSNLKAGD